MWEVAEARIYQSAGRLVWCGGKRQSRAVSCIPNVIDLIGSGGSLSIDQCASGSVGVCSIQAVTCSLCVTIIQAR